jgi:16S rRNA (guanine966-N2)-methyltransferase
VAKPAPSAHLRVQGGELGGRRLGAPRGIRPSQGLVREAIFNMVGPAVVDAVVLDLFAGSGALGIEALSRGAARATFVDSDEAAVKVVRRNLAELGLADRGQAVRADAARWLAARPEEVAAATLVLLDPPYGDPAFERTLALLDDLASAGAVVVAERAHRDAAPRLARLETERERRYGDTAVSVMVASS